MIITNYAKLFSIEFLHDFYTDREDILRDISVEPDEVTSKLMKGYRLQLKTVKNRLLCFVQTIATIDTSGGSPKFNIVNKPLVSFNENGTLNLRITINASRFFDNSNLRRYYSNTMILRFGNDSGNKVDELLSLSVKIPAYKTSGFYQPGMLTTSTSNLSFEALKDSDPSHPQNTSKTGYWKHVTDFVQYVNQADLINNPTDEKVFALIVVSFRKDLANQFGLLRKSMVDDEDNTILGKDYIIHFKNIELN
jgi:hypothetical protein